MLRTSAPLKGALGLTRLMHTITPPAISKAVERLIAKVAPGQRPTYLNVDPAELASVNECFPNVANHIQKFGGEAVHGWLIWEWPSVLVEAEFHAVWKSPDNHLVEITPKEHGETKVLFLPDNKRVYRGVAVDNVRMPLRDDAVIKDYVHVSEEIVKVLNKGERAHQFGEIRVPAAEIQPLLKFQSMLGYMLTNGLRDHDICACGSGKKYKKCHAMRRTK